MNTEVIKPTASIKQSTNPNTKVTGDSEAIISGILAWLTDPKSTPHCTITGGPGAGKTHMIKELMEAHKTFLELGIGNTTPLTICGTTHESLDVIKKHFKDLQLNTLYSILSLVPVKGVICRRYGNQKKASTYTPKPNEIDTTTQILLCDESNFIDQETLTIISKWNPNTRIIFVGSENQLGPNMGKSPIFTQGWDNFYLNTAYRASNADVQAVYDSSEEDVINKSSIRYVENNPSIIYMNAEDWEATMLKAYNSPMAHKCITLAYTNKRVFELVGMIRASQGKAGHFNLAGPTQALRAGSSKIPKKKVPLRRNENGHVYVPVKTESGELRSYVGETYEHYEYLMSKDHKREPNEIYPSLVASMEARTIHGAQGGTWDYTFLDMTNMYSLKCRDIETYRRAKHVAESRHTTKLFVKIS